MLVMSFKRESSILVHLPRIRGTHDSAVRSFFIYRGVHEPRVAPIHPLAVRFLLPSATGMWFSGESGTLPFPDTRETFSARG